MLLQAKLHTIFPVPVLILWNIKLLITENHDRLQYYYLPQRNAMGRNGLQRTARGMG